MWVGSEDHSDQYEAAEATCLVLSLTFRKHLLWKSLRTQCYKETQVSHTERLTGEEPRN